MPSLTEIVCDPLTSATFRRALIAVCLLTMTCAPLGVHIVLRRLGFLGDAIAHATLPGLALAWILKARLLYGGLIGGVLAALGIGMLSKRRDLAEDSAIGVTMTGMLALGVLLMSLEGTAVDLGHMLFGHIIGISHEDLVSLSVVALITLTLTLYLTRIFALTACDPTYARTIGVNPDRCRFQLMVLVALAVVTGASAVGVILITALLITPAAAARLLCRRLDAMIIVATVIALISGTVGLWLSYWHSIPTGAAIVTVATTQFGLACLWRKARPGRQNGV